MAKINKYANTNGPLETIPIDFALLPYLECVIKFFSPNFPPKESPESTDTF